MITTIIETNKTPQVLDYIADTLQKNELYSGTYADSYMTTKIYDDKVRLYMFVDYKNVYVRPVWFAVFIVLFVGVFHSWLSWWHLLALPFIGFELFLTRWAFYYGFIRGARKRGIKEKVKMLDVGQCLKEELQ